MRLRDLTRGFERDPLLRVGAGAMFLALGFAVVVAVAATLERPIEPVAAKLEVKSATEPLVRFDPPERNVYLAGHRLGWPGTGSHLVFYRLNELAGGERIILRDRRGIRYFSTPSYRRLSAIQPGGKPLTRGSGVHPSEVLPRDGARRLRQTKLKC